MMLEYHTIKHHKFFADFDDAELSELIHEARIKTYQPNEIILSVNDITTSIYFILSGKAKSYLANDKGKQVTLNEFACNDIFGELAVICNKPRTASVIALTLCRCLVISKITFEYFYKNNLNASNKVVDILANTILRDTVGIERIALQSVQERLMKVIYERASSVGENHYIAEVTHNELACIAACSRETVTRALNELTKDGSISQLDKKRIQVQIK